jgi:apolipoprotein N-acyltransferase
LKKENILLALIGGLLLSLSYPACNLEFLAFFAFIPLFFAIKNTSKGKAFLLAYITGVIFWLGTIYWLIHVTLPGLILLVLYLSLYFGNFGLFFRYAIRNTQYSILNTITIPTAWIFLEYLRSKLFTGLPWALLGYSQYLNLPIIQIADITGVWGVSFLVMLVNVAIYQLIAHRSWVIGKSFSKSSDLRPMICYLLPLLVLLFSLFYGFYKLSLHPTPYTLYPIKVTVIQGNIPQHEKWNEGFKDAIFERYEALTKESAKDKPDLIIWPETSVPDVIGEEPEVLDRILKLAKSVKTPLLIGSVTTSYPTPYTLHPKPYNSAILISGEGEILNQYDKLHLVPFGEYIPLEKFFPSLRKWIGIPIGDFKSGQEYTVFKLNTQYSRLPMQAKIGGQAIPNTQFAVLICFEDIFPGLSRRFVKEGAQFLVNITNDAWFMRSSAPYQHVQASVFRAVENRVPVVRTANTGVSCFIDQNGKVYDKVMTGKKDIFVLGYKTSEVMTKVYSRDRFHRDCGNLSP